MGLAVSDQARIFSFPLSVLSIGSPNYLTELKRIITEKGVDVIVIGYPLRTDGSKSKSCEKVDEFKRELSEHFPGMEIVLWDERFTSKLANDAMAEIGINSRKRRNTVDSVAASIILQNYLESIR